jgi:hypothetical protein
MFRTDFHLISRLPCVFGRQFGLATGENVQISRPTVEETSPHSLKFRANRVISGSLWRIDINLCAVCRLDDDWSVIQRTPTPALRRWSDEAEQYQGR